jgi:hypothetical protein
MAGDWIKVEKATARKPEVLRLADILGVHPDHAFGLCIRFWFWCDDQLVDGHAPRVTNMALNSIVGQTGFAEALTEVGWIRGNGQFWEVPNFNRHLSEGAKNRALALERKRKQREDVTVLSRDERDESVTRARGESKRESQLLNSNGTSTGSAPDVPVGRLPRKFIREGFQANLIEVDWGRVVIQAEAVSRKIPPATEKDRRNWLRFGVLAQTTFSEAWLMGSVDAVLCAAQTRKTRQAHLYSVLRSKAGDDGIEGDAFDSMLGCIEIPSDVWKSGVLEIRK